jgi:hypothetical protein
MYCILSKAKSFLDRLMDIFYHLDKPTKLDAIFKLSSLLPEDLVQNFKELAIQACENEIFLMPATSINDNAKSVIAPDYESSYISATQNSHGSKRAKLMIEVSRQFSQLSQTPTKTKTIIFNSQSDKKVQIDKLNILPSKSSAANILTNRTNKFAKLEEMMLKPSSASQSSASTSSKKLISCGICRGIATCPCVARCGHINCRSCWTTWLEVKKFCPQCRASTSSETLKEIVLKRTASSIS